MKTVHLSIETGPRFRGKAWALLIVAAYLLDGAVCWLVPPVRNRVWCTLSRTLFYTKAVR